MCCVGLSIGSKHLLQSGIIRVVTSISAGLYVAKTLFALANVVSRAAETTRAEFKRLAERKSRHASVNGIIVVGLLSWFCSACAVAAIPLGLKSLAGSKQPTRFRRGPRHGSLFGLARVEFTVPRTVTSRAVRSYRTLSPLPDPLRAIGGLLSVALVVGLRLPGVTWHPALWEPGLSSPPVCLPEGTTTRRRLPGQPRAHYREVTPTQQTISQNSAF